MTNTIRLEGTAEQLGEEAFIKCAQPAIAHLVRSMRQLLAPEVAAEQVLRLWAVFISAASGAMLADVGKEAAEVVLEAAQGLVDQFDQANQAACKGASH